MANDDISLKPLLLGDVPSAAISLCVGAACAAAQRGLTAASGVDWASVAADIGDKIVDMFDIPLVGMMIGAWRDLRELADCADSNKHSPDESISLSLVDHDLEASFEPHLDITISGLPTLRVNFEIIAEIELHGIEVTIQGGMIRAMRLGSCQAAARVMCEGAVIFERSSRKLALPGEIVLPQSHSGGPPG